MTSSQAPGVYIDALRGSKMCPTIKANLMQDMVNQMKTELKSYSDRIRKLTVAQLSDEDVKTVPSKYNKSLSKMYKWNIDDIQHDLKGTPTADLMLFQTRSNVNEDSFFLATSEKKAYNPKFLENQLVALHFRSKTSNKETTYWTEWNFSSNDFVPKKEDYDWITSPEEDVRWYLLMLDDKQDCYLRYFEKSDKEYSIKWVNYNDLGDMERCLLTLIHQGDKDSIRPL